MQVARRFVDYIQMKMDETSSEILTDICQHLLRFTIEGISQIPSLSCCVTEVDYTLCTGLFKNSHSPAPDL
jgi:hypothetical protein